MRANLAQREPAMLKQWQDDDLYQHIRTSRAGCEKYILHDGPPMLMVIFISVMRLIKP